MSATWANPINMEVIIPSGGTRTKRIPLAGRRLLGLYTPAAMTGTELSYLSVESGVEVPLYNADGSAVVKTTISTSARRMFDLSEDKFRGIKEIVILSNGTEAAERRLVLVLGPIS